MSKFGTALLNILTFGLYGAGKSKKEVKRYRKDGLLRVDKSIEREGIGTISNATDVATDSPFGNNKFNVNSVEDVD